PFRSHQAGQAAADGQPESYAASRAHMALLQLHEWLEYAFQLLLRNSDTLVADSHVVPPRGAASFRIGGSSSPTWRSSRTAHHMDPAGARLVVRPGTRISRIVPGIRPTRSSRVVSRGLHFHRGIRELHRIRKQVHQDLPNAAFVAHHQLTLGE